MSKIRQQVIHVELITLDDEMSKIIEETPVEIITEQTTMTNEGK